jgi:hypothetical protein
MVLLTAAVALLDINSGTDISAVQNCTAALEPPPSPHPASKTISIRGSNTWK